MGLASIYAVVYMYPEAPDDVMPTQTSSVVEPTLQKSDFVFQRSSHPLLREASFVVTQDPAAVPIVPMADHLLQKFYPRYPRTAITDRVSGLVTVEALIGSDGTVEELQAKGPFDLQKEALRAIALWIYKPYLVDGHPTEVRTLIKIRYVLGTAKPSDTNDVDMAVDTQEQPVFLTKISHSPKPVEPGMVRVSPFDMLKYVQTQVKPEYPKRAKKAGVTGIVIVDVTVDQTGKVLEAKAVAGPSMFYGPATEAVRQWTFKPYLDNGNAKEVATSILVHFE
jgi:TonB family protein